MTVENRQEYLKINKQRIPIQTILSKPAYARSHKETQALENWQHTQLKNENRANNRAIFSGFLRENGQTVYVPGGEISPTSWYSREDEVTEVPNLDDVFTG